jgi:hypothetical protein
MVVLGRNYRPFIALQQGKLCNAPLRLTTLRERAQAVQMRPAAGAPVDVAHRAFALLHARLTRSELAAKTCCGLA